MQLASVPVATTCDHPGVDAQIQALIVELVDRGLPIRQATETAARKAADAAVAQQWPGDLVDFVIIRTVDLGSRFARAA